MTIGEAAMYVGLLVADSLAADVELHKALISTHVKTISLRHRPITKTQDGTTGILDDEPRNEMRKNFAKMHEQQVDESWSPESLLKNCPLYAQVILRPCAEMAVMVQSED